MIDSDIKKVQTRLLEMGKTISRILEKHNIPYMLAYGTLLGAIRHDGFIPWDDDFDFYLFDDTYQMAIECLKNELPSDLFLENQNSEPRYFHAWAHVKDLHSLTSCTEFPQDNEYTHKGISVDLYMCKKIESKNLAEYLNEENYRYINRRYNIGLMTKDEFHSRMMQLQKKRQNPIQYLGKSEFIYGTINAYNHKYMEIEEVFPLKKHVFEDTEFYVPNKSEEILTNIYGDYLELPPIEKRQSHYSSVIFL